MPRKSTVSLFQKDQLYVRVGYGKPHRGMFHDATTLIYDGDRSAPTKFKFENLVLSGNNTLHIGALRAYIS